MNINALKNHGIYSRNNYFFLRHKFKDNLTDAYWKHVRCNPSWCTWTKRFWKGFALPPDALVGQYFLKQYCKIWSRNTDMKIFKLLKSYLLNNSCDPKLHLLPFTLSFTCTWNLIAFKNQHFHLLYWNKQERCFHTASIKAGLLDVWFALTCN